MSLARYNPCWENARAGKDSTRVFEDEFVLLATDFEGGNGNNIRRIEDGRYAVTLEPEPGNNRYSGMAYYVCFGIRSKPSGVRNVRVRMEGNGLGRERWDLPGKDVPWHMVQRRGGQWSQLDPNCIHAVKGMRDTLEVELQLPGSGEGDNTLFVSDYHWWPYSEMVEYLRGLDDKRARVREIGRSFQNRAIYAVEMGSEKRNAPCMVHAQTPQPSEMGSLACRAMIDFLLSGSPDASTILEGFRVCFIPMTNPDGTVLGYGVSDAQGHMPYFEAHLAASGDPDATPENRVVWQYLRDTRPILFWEWHSNHWSRRPGHMLLRYRPQLLDDKALRRIWEDIDKRLLGLPDTYHEEWTSHTEGPYQNSMGFQAVTRLGIISCMIKQHDKYPLEQSGSHAVACLKSEASAFLSK